MKTPIRITNVVCTANFNTSIYLPMFVSRYPFLEWNRKKFAAATLRFTDPKTTCLVFGSGRIVCTGASTLIAAKVSVLQALMMVQECGYTATITDWRVQNIASAFEFGRKLNLDKLYDAYPSETTYSPELFPALIFRPSIATNGVYLIFESGRVVITGCKCVESVHSSYDHVGEVISVLDTSVQTST